MALLRKGDRAGVEQQQAVFRAQHGDVGVAVQQRVARRQRRQAVGAEHMAVGQKAAPAVGQKQQGAVRLHRETQQHLVDLGVAVAAHGEDARRQPVEQRRDRRRVVVGRDGVARPVIEQVAEQHERVGPLGGKAAEHRAAGAGGAVEVGGNQQLHGSISFGKQRAPSASAQRSVKQAE